MTLPPITVTSFRVSEPPGRTSKARSKAGPTMMVCSGLVPWMMIGLFTSRSPEALLSSSLPARLVGVKTGKLSYCRRTSVSVPEPAVQAPPAVVLVFAAWIASRRWQGLTRPSGATLMVAAWTRVAVARHARASAAVRKTRVFIVIVIVIVLIPQPSHVPTRSAGVFRFNAQRRSNRTLQPREGPSSATHCSPSNPSANRMSRIS